MTMEQVVTQLQQEVFTLKAEVADQSGFADAVRAIDSLATAQGKKDAPSLIDVEGFGRPKEILLQGGGFSTVVEEDGGTLCRCDQGVRDGVGMVS